MPVQQVTRNTETVLADLERLRGQTQATLAGTPSSQALLSLKDELTRATAEVQALLDRALAEGQPNPQLRLALANTCSLHGRVDRAIRALAANHEQERNREGVDTDAARRTASRAVTEVAEQGIAPGQMSEAELREVCRPFGTCYPGLRPSTAVPTGPEAAAIAARWTGGDGEARTLESYQAPLSPPELRENWRALFPGGLPSASTLRNTLTPWMSAGLVSTGVGSGNAVAPTPGDPARAPTAPGAAQPGPRVGTSRPGGPGGLHAPASAAPSFRLSAPSTPRPAAQPSGSGLELPPELTGAALSSAGAYWETQTTVNLTLWCMRYRAQELEAISDRKELARERDELEVLNAQYNITRARREVDRMRREAFSRLVNSISDLSDARYTGMVQSLIESDPVAAREDLSGLQDMTREAMPHLGAMPESHQRALQSLPHADSSALPTPWVLTESELARVEASDPELAARYRQQFERWEGHSGVAGRAALYSSEMTNRLLFENYVHTPPSQRSGDNPMDAILGAVESGTNRPVRDALRFLNDGEPLPASLIAQLPPTVRDSVGWMETQRQSAITEFNETMLELGHSSFATSAVNDLRSEINRGFLHGLGQSPGEDGFEHLQYLQLLSQQTALFDEGAMRFSPRHLGENGEPEEATALAGMAERSFADALAMQDDDSEQLGHIVSAAGGNDQAMEGLPPQHAAVAEQIARLNDGDPLLRAQLAGALGVREGSEAWNREVAQQLVAAQALTIAERAETGTRGSGAEFRLSDEQRGDLEAITGRLPPAGRALMEVLGNQAAGTAIQQTRSEFLTDVEDRELRKLIERRINDVHAQTMARLEQAIDQIVGSQRAGLRMDRAQGRAKIAQMRQVMMATAERLEALAIPPLA